MQVSAAAGAALFAQSTAAPPAMGFAEARARLEAFDHAQATQNLATKVVVDGPLQDAALAFLTYCFTPAGFDIADPEEDYDSALRAARLVMPHADAAHRAFLCEIVFNVAEPTDHLSLAGIIMGSIAPQDLERQLLERAHSRNELHIHNALHLPYYVYGRDPSFRLSDSARAELCGLADELKRRPKLNSVVRRGLRRVRLPVNL